MTLNKFLSLSPSSSLSPSPVSLMSEAHRDSLAGQQLHLSPYSSRTSPSNASAPSTVTAEAKLLAAEQSLLMRPLSVGLVQCYKHSLGQVR